MVRSGGGGGGGVKVLLVLLSFFLHFGRRISTMAGQRPKGKLTKERLQTKVLTKEEGVLSGPRKGKTRDKLAPDSPQCTVGSHVTQASLLCCRFPSTPRQQT